MKTLEIIEKLTKNPSYDRVFETKDFNGDVMKSFMLPKYEGAKDIIVTKGWDGEIRELPLNDFMRNREWEEVKEPLTFIELLKSTRKNNKTISVENKTHGVGYHRFYLSDMLDDLINEFPSNVIAEILLDSEFYIED